ncbi:MAG: alpha/beta fold hydrolase [Solirubrobacteraceae bacterium]
MTPGRRLVIATGVVAVLVGSFAATGSVLSSAAERDQRQRLVESVRLQFPRRIVRALRAPLPIRRQHVGRGADAAVVAYRGDVSDPRPVVVFLHGWGLAVRDYRAWIDHLVRRGATVVAPRYQTTRRADPAGVRDAARRGLERALRELTPAGDVMVLAGHSAGGALAADLAVTTAADPEMPRVRGIFAVYPGRAILGYPGGIPAAPLDELGANLALRALAGANDVVVGEAPAQEMVSAAANVEDRRLVRVTEPSVSDHFAPLETSAAARRAFWSPLDQMVFGR